MMKRVTLWVEIALLLTVGSVLRFTGLDWDQGIAAHPDERYIVDTAETMGYAGTMDPFEVAPSFPYGHLPLYLLISAKVLLHEVDPLLVGRGLSAVSDLATIVLTLLLGREVFGEKVGVLAASMLSVTVLHVQQAHFYTSDCLLTCFVTCGLLFSARVTQRGRTVDAILAGVAVGLAIGTKASALLMLLPLWVGCSVRRDDPRLTWKCRLYSGLFILVAFGASNPFALWRLPTFLDNLRLQGAIMRGRLDVPYTRQYYGTWPFAYPAVQQLRWGMGLVEGLVCLSGFLSAVWCVVHRPVTRAELLVTAWGLPYIGAVGALYAKFPRYLLPVTPCLILWGARFLLSLQHRFSAVVRLATGLVILCPCARSVALVTMYTEPHPWVNVSAWIRNEIPAGSTIVIEAWDHPLPVYGADNYDVVQLPVFDEDSGGKATVFGDMLRRADYVVIASRRGYVSLTRMPERYPVTVQCGALCVGR